MQLRNRLAQDVRDGARRKGPRIEQSSLGLAVRLHAKAQCWNLIGIDLATLI